MNENCGAGVNIGRLVGDAEVIPKGALEDSSCLVAKGLPKTDAGRLVVTTALGTNPR